MKIGQNAKVSWIAKITFSKGGSVVKNWYKTSMSEIKLQTSEIHL